MTVFARAAVLAQVALSSPRQSARHHERDARVGPAFKRYDRPSAYVLRCRRGGRLQGQGRTKAMTVESSCHWSALVLSNAWAVNHMAVADPARLR